MLRKLLTLLILSVCFVSLSAQDTTNAILVGVDGTWYSWSPNETSLTELPLTAPTQDITFSPDRTKAVYRVDNSELNPGMFPANLFLVDVATNQTIQLTPEDNFLIRSYPAFSPDSTQIAWVEYSEEGGVADAYLMIYDIATSTAKRVANWTLGFQDGGVYLQTPQWGDVGILNKYFTMVEGANGEYQVQLIDPLTATSRLYTLLQVNMNAAQYDPYPESVYFNGASSLVVVPQRATTNVWTLDLNSSQRIASTPMSQYGVTLGEFQMIYDRTLKETLFAYRDQPVLRVGGDTFAITPNGDGLLFTQFDKLYSFSNGVPIEIARFPLQEITLLGATLEPTPLTPTQIDIANAKIGTCNLLTRLTIGQDALVIPGLGANALREVPGLDGAEIMDIPEGAIVYSTYQAPRCADGYVWHYVYYEGTNVGWTAEGDLDGTYWLSNEGS